MSAKISSSDKNNTSGIKNINMSEMDDKVSKETDQWKETVEEITNQRLVKAQIYMKRFSNRQQHSNIKETSKTSSEWLDCYNNESLFNSADFPLKLAPSIEHDLL